MLSTIPRHLQKESLYTAILEELSCKDWSSSTQASVDELGLAMGTHLGLKRGRNEDRFAVARVRAPNAETYTVAIICDGVGGSQSGDLAATLAVTSVLHQLSTQQARPALKSLAGVLVRRADDDVRQVLKGQGTSTLVMFLATAEGQLACVSVGDSRVYEWDAGPAKLTQITTDDTVENELKGLPGDHRALLQARGLQNRLSQALGESGRLSDELRVQVFEKEHFAAGVLLGSDGLWRAAKDFQSVAANSKTAVDVIRRTITLANWVGGVDNSTVIAIENIEKFSRPEGAPTAQRQGVSLTLWLGQSKLTILSDLNTRGREASNSSTRAEKPKKMKPKEGKVASDESQLKFDGDRPQEPRPVIEVTIGEAIPVPRK